MGFKRYATAHWEGDLKTGQGRMSTPQSGLFDGQRYSYNTRFGEEKGTNPEEFSRLPMPAATAWRSVSCCRTPVSSRPASTRVPKPR